LTTIDWGRSFRLPQAGRIVVFVAEGGGYAVQLAAVGTSFVGAVAWSVDSHNRDARGRAASVGYARDSGLPALAVNLDSLGEEIEAVAVTLTVGPGPTGAGGPIRTGVYVEERTVHLEDIPAPDTGSAILTLVELHYNDGWWLAAVGRQEAQTAHRERAVPRKDSPGRLSASRAVPPPTKAPGKPRKALLAVLLVAVAAGSFALYRVNQDPPRGRFADPTKVSIPPLEDRAATAEYLRGEGAPLVNLVDLTAPIAAGDPEKTACRDLIDNQLPALGDPPDLLDLAHRIPDPATSEMAVEDVRAVIETLALCTQGQSVDSSRLRFARTVFERRLQEVGVR
jgi:hypothetical protein